MAVGRRLPHFRRCAWKTSRSATRGSRNPRCATSRSTSAPARWWHSSAKMARAKRRSPSCSVACTHPWAAACCGTRPTPRASSRPRSANPWRCCFRTSANICSTSARTSAWAVTNDWAILTASVRPPSTLARTRSFATCPRATAPYWVPSSRAATTCRSASGSGERRCGAVIALIADDLTGASDAGVQFARRGLATHVVFDVPEGACTADVEALAVDTETRAVSPAEAYRRVRDVADRLCAMQPDHVYKKVDSTLRGNLGAEIDAVLDAFDLQLQLAIVAPAYPIMERTTRDGTHRLHGTPVHETEIGRDPKTPVRESNLVRLLESGSRRTPALVSLQTVERGPQAIRDEVDALARRGVSLVLCDAETDRALPAAIVCWLSSRARSAPRAPTSWPRHWGVSRPTPPARTACADLS